MLNRPYQQYQRMQAETARPGDLVVMLYEGAIAAIGRGCLHLERGDLEPAHGELVRAQEIVSELENTLDLRAGDLAFRLQAIYEYLRQRLITANLRKDAEPAREAARLLRELLPAWREAANAASAPRPAPLAATYSGVR